MFDKSAAEVLSAIPNQNPQLVIVRKFSLVHMNMVLQILLLTAVFSSFYVMLLKIVEELNILLNKNDFKLKESCLVNA